jgi:transposase
MPISALPDDVEALKRLVLAREADLADARARQSSSEALIAHLRLTIEKMRRDVYGQRSERGARLLDQMELELEELEAAASEDELAAERAAAAADTTVRSFTRKRPLPQAVRGASAARADHRARPDRVHVLRVDPAC